MSLRRDAEAVEADFARYYHLDFMDLWPGTQITWRKMLMVVSSPEPLNTVIRNRMPEEVLMERAGDPAQSPWSSLESLMAVLIDELRQFSWMYASKNSEKTVQRPEPIKRPGIKTAARRRAMPIAAAMAMDPRLRGLSQDEAQAQLNRITGRGCYCRWRGAVPGCERLEQLAPVQGRMRA